MKNLLVLLILVAAVGLFFHDKSQMDELQKTKDDNASLAQQLSTAQSDLTSLQTRFNQLSAQSRQPSYASPLAQPAASSIHPLPGTGLDRPAYRN